MKHGRTILLSASFIVASSWASIALAQAPQPPATPELQALQARVLNEVSSNLQCNSNVIALQRELESVKAELAKLKEPPAAKKEDRIPLPPKKP